MRLCFVIQRYGLEVAGGSELHCRWLAGRLSARHEVRIVTTCALDYLEWRNHYPPGADRVDGPAGASGSRCGARAPSAASR